MNDLVLFVGTHHAGKSTLVSELKKRREKKGRPVFVSGEPVRPTLSRYEVPLDEFLSYVHHANLGDPEAFLAWVRLERFILDESIRREQRVFDACFKTGVTDTPSVYVMDRCLIDAYTYFHLTCKMFAQNNGNWETWGPLIHRHRFLKEDKYLFLLRKRPMYNRAHIFFCEAIPFDAFTVKDRLVDVEYQLSIEEEMLFLLNKVWSKFTLLSRDLSLDERLDVVEAELNHGD